jgi:hypothetical protein
VPTNPISEGRLNPFVVEAKVSRFYCPQTNVSEHSFPPFHAKLIAAAAFQENSVIH